MRASLGSVPRCALLALLVALVAGPASAAPPPEAARLFKECVAIFEARQMEAARVCFQRVYALYPSAKVLYNLGRTEETLGHLAEAYETYQRCAEDTTNPPTPAHLEARKKVEELAGRLGFIRVGQDDAGAVVSIDGEARWRPAPGCYALTPGIHEIRIEARGRPPWRSQVSVAAGETRDVSVGPAGKKKEPAAGITPQAGPSSQPASGPMDAPPRRGGLRTWSYVAGGAGLASLILGMAYGLHARSVYHEALKNCSPTEKALCDATGVARTNDARSAATVSTVTLSIGGAAVIAGAVLYLLPGRERAASLTARTRIVPSIGGDSAGIALEASF
jgi:hypothetical protein